MQRTRARNSITPQTIFRFIGDPSLEESGETHFVSFRASGGRARLGSPPIFLAHYDRMKVFENIYRRFVIGRSKTLAGAGGERCRGKSFLAVSDRASLLQVSTGIL
jgi:hypothetical protein